MTELKYLQGSALFLARSVVLEPAWNPCFLISGVCVFVERMIVFRYSVDTYEFIVTYYVTNNRVEKPKFLSQIESGLYCFWIKLPSPSGQWLGMMGMKSSSTWMITGSSCWHMQKKMYFGRQSTFLHFCVRLISWCPKQGQPKTFYCLRCCSKHPYPCQGA